jgi:glycosyltransferase involved in cell wall biosynthesis
VRSEKFVRYLPDFGWGTTIVCRDEGLRGDNDARLPVVRVASRLSPAVSYQLSAWLWATQIMAPARSLLRSEKCDLVYVSCPPYPHALSALRLSREAGVPLVVDLRDAWSLDPHESSGLAKRWAKRFLCRWVYPFAEKRLLEGAAEIIANTPSMRREYARVLGWPEGRIRLLPNGFDEADFQGAHVPPPHECPVFLHCGRFSEVGDRDPRLLLRGLRALLDRGVQLRLRIVGDDTRKLRRDIEALGLGDFVSVRAPVPHSEAIREIREADVVVICQPRSRTEVTPVAGKTYEYIRSGRPILAIVPAGDNATVVESYAAVHEIVTTFELDDVTRAMARLCARISQGGTPRGVTPASEFVERYERRRLAARLAALFDGVVAARPAFVRSARRK